MTSPKLEIVVIDHDAIHRLETLPLILMDYADAGLRHIVDETTGLVSCARLPDEADCERVEFRRGVRGFGVWRKIGIFQRKKIFIGIYSFNDRLVLRLGGTEITWPDGALSIVRKSLFPGIKRFEIARNSETVIKINYRYSDREVWPDNGDILSYVIRMTESESDVRRTIRYWAERAEGKDVWAQLINDSNDG